MASRNFEPIQARELADVFDKHGVRYLFLGKGGAILLGYPGTTQDVDVFAPRDSENGKRIATAVRELGFNLQAETELDLQKSRDFVQLKDGPFDLDIVHAPDSFPDFETAWARRHQEGIFPVANLRDIIASKRGANRMKDLVDLPLLEKFREEFEKVHAPKLESAADRAMDRFDQKT